MADLTQFDTIVRSLIAKNLLGCTSYWTIWKHHLPLERVHEMYTAKFAYLDPAGKRVRTKQETYNSVGGHEYGVAAVLSNRGNVTAHKGKVRYLKAAGLFSLILKCHDPGDEPHFLCLARNRVTMASCDDEAIRRRVEEWTDSVPELE